MLGFQSRLSPPSSDVEDSDLTSEDCGESQRGPKNLSASLAHASVYLDHFPAEHKPHCLKRVCTRQTPIMENLRLSIEKSEGMSFGCLVDQRDRLVASSFGSNSPLVEKHLVEYSTKTILRSHRLGAKSCWRSRRFESMVNLRSMPPHSPCQSNHRQLFTMRDPWRKRERDEA